MLRKGMMKAERILIFVIVILSISISVLSFFNLCSWSILTSGVLLTAVLSVRLAFWNRQQPKFHFCFAFLLAMIALVPCQFMSRAIRVREEEKAKLLSSSANATVTNLLQNRLKSDVAALDRMAARVKVGFEDKKIFWKSDAQNYERDGAEYRAIEWINSNLQVVWVEPLKGNEAALHLNLTFESRRKNAVSRARNQALVAVSQSIDLVQGGKGFLVYAPVFRDDRFQGMIAGVIDLAKFADQIPASFRRKYFYQILESGNPIFSSSLTPRFNSQFSSTQRIKFPGLKWEVRLVPAPETLNIWLTQVPRLVTFFGIAFSALVFLLVKLWGRSQKNQQGRMAEQAFIAALSGASLDIIYVMDLASATVVHMNESGIEFFGLTMETISEPGFPTIRKILFPNGELSLEEIIRRYSLIKPREIQTSEYHIKGADGIWKWLQFRKSVLSFNKDGSVKQILGCCQDITAQREAEERLRRSKESLDEIFALAPIGMAIADRNGVFQKANNALCNIVGYSEAELIGMHFKEITSPEDIKNDLDSVKQMLSGAKQTFSLEKRYLHKNGDSVWVELNVSALRGTDGELEMFIGQIQDISSRKALETQLIASQNALAKQSSGLIQEMLQLENDINVDALTGINNRRWFDEFLNQNIEVCKKYGHEFSLILFDVDHFKKFNDTYGHAVGDEVLKKVGQVLKEATRDADHPARYGGEEFAVLCCGTGLGVAVKIAERIRKAFEKIDSLPQTITASFGVTAYSSEVSTSIAMIKTADNGLYEAKSLGRNRTCIGAISDAGESKSA